jgi:hypothetical protein
MNKREVDISGLDKKDVLKQLWLGSEPAIVFLSRGIEPPEYDPKEADKVIEKGYVDYLCGRAIKTELRTDKLENYKYDKYNGEGSMQKAIDLLREQKKEEKEPEIAISNCIIV